MAGVVTYDESVQRGQVGQPSPDPVSRTAPPVITRSTLVASAARAVTRRSAGLRRRSSTAPGYPQRPDPRPAAPEGSGRARTASGHGLPTGGPGNLATGRGAQRDESSSGGVDHRRG